MNPYIADADFTLYVGDVRAVLRELPDASVDCCVTSPPYWGLRCYGHDDQIGIEASPQEFVGEMVAVFREVRRVLAPHGTLWLNLGDSYANDTKWGGTTGGKHVSALHGAAGGLGRDKRVTGLKAKDLVGIPWRVAFALQADGWCLRSDIVWAKSNPMPESVTDRPTKSHEYVFMLSKAEWRGIENPLRLDRGDAMWLAAMMDGEGTLCVNTRKDRTYQPTYSAALRCYNTNRALIERVAEIAGCGTITRKTNSGTDGTRECWQWQCGGRTAVPVLDAIEPYLIAKRQQAHLLLELQGMRRHHGPQAGFGKGMKPRPAVVTRRQEEIARGCSELNMTGSTDVQVFPWKRGYWKPLPYHFDQEAVREPHSENAHHVLVMSRASSMKKASLVGKHGGGAEEIRLNPAGRNVRSVWEIATQPYPDAHFATFPEALPERCIKAGCPEFVCVTCGEARVRIVESQSNWQERKANGAEQGAGWSLGGPRDGRSGDQNSVHGAGMSHDLTPKGRVDRGWSDCGHGNYRTGVVLDPFMGSGTTALVARRLGRRSIGVELNPEYAELAARRLQQLSLLAEEAV